MTPPTVSVIIPTRDRAHMLRQAVDSAVRQRDVELEVLVVDDCSSDGTSEVLATLAEDRLRWTRTARSRGAAAARNRAIADATGHWLAFLDDDDLWAPTWLAVALERARPEIGLIHGGRLIVDQARRVRDHALPYAAGRPEWDLSRGNYIGGPSSVVVRRELVEQVGGFDERFSALADWRLWLQLRELTGFAACPTTLVAYMEHAGNMHVADPFGVLDEFALLRSVADVDAAAEDFHRWLAHVALRFGNRRRAARIWARRAGGRPRLVPAREAAIALVRPLPPELPVHEPPEWLEPYVSAA